jgi:hypothetical protein
MLDDFALDNLRVSKDRYYLPPSEGGIGLIHIGTFLMSQKCSWVKRAHANCIDNWRLRLKALSPSSDVSLLQRIDINPQSNPILYNIAEAFELFVRCYGSTGNNLLVTPIFSNSAICRSRFDKKLLDIEFFGKNFYNSHRSEIRRLTISDCYNGNSFKTMEDFRVMNLPFSMVTWMALRSAITLAKKSIPVLDTPPRSLAMFISRIKKGSKGFRNVIDRSVYRNNRLSELTVLNSFAEITNTRLPDTTILKNFISGWNCTFLDNNFREFIYKCRNNCLRTGDRLSHLLPSFNDRCFLCKGVIVDSSARETFLHLFRRCVVTSSLLLKFNKYFKLEWNSDNFYFKNLYWYGANGIHLDRQALLVYDIFRYQIWNMKNRKIIDFDFILSNTIDQLRTIFILKPSIKISFTRNNNLANILQATG